MRADVRDALTRAIVNNQGELLQTLLSNKSPKVLTDVLGSVFKSQMDQVKEIKANNRQNPQRQAAAIAAINDKAMGYIKLLLDHGADMNAIISPRLGYNLFTIACTHASPEIIQMMIERGADLHFRSVYNLNPIQLAFQTGDGQVMSLFLDRGLTSEEINRYALLNHAVTSCQTPEDIYERLLLMGANVNTTYDHDGLTPLNCAVKRANMAAIEFLIERAGAEVNGCDEAGRTPLETASYLGHAKVAQVLLQRGADVTKGTRCPLTLACSQRHAELAELLLDHGANIEGRMSDHWQPITAAVELGHGDMVELLLRRGVTIVYLALRLAIAKQQTRIVELLFKRDLEVTSGICSLHWAAEAGDLEFMEFLLERGVNVNAEIEGVTALARADEMRREKVCRFIVKRLVLMRAKGLHVSEANWRHVRSQRKLTLFHNECDDEVKLLRATKFVGDTKFCYFDVLTIEDIDEIAKLMSNASRVSGIVKSRAFTRKFLNYGKMIVDRFEELLQLVKSRTRDSDLTEAFDDYLKHQRKIVEYRELSDVTYTCDEKQIVSMLTKLKLKIK